MKYPVGHFPRLEDQGKEKTEKRNTGETTNNNWEKKHALQVPKHISPVQKCSMRAKLVSIKIYVDGLSAETN